MPRPFYQPETRRTPTLTQPVSVHLRQPPDNAVVAAHSHSYGQLVFPVRGGLKVAAARTAWIAPVFRAVWLPPGFTHEITMLGKVEFYVAYVDPSAAPLPLTGCTVIEVSAL
ncbi:MAG TPA: AraC family transcriptional regulator, partial [Magnetospirillaceae bacterium]|nr:AraC family transcriptional regulator [Magnetospirillaceae bacterium]